MLEITDQFDTREYTALCFPFSLEQALFFDIETTGLSADVSSLYLIGVLYYKEGIFYTRQWFAETYRQEAALLHAFFQFAANYSYLVHYNGTGFDIPFLIKKLDQQGLSYTFDTFTSLDVYRLLRPYRQLFSLTSLKQKAVENYLGVHREDQLSGKALIQIYTLYLQKNLLKNHPKRDALLQQRFGTVPAPDSTANDIGEEERNLLLLHNKDDLAGLLAVSRMLSYASMLHCPEKVIAAWQKDDCAVFSYQNKHAVPQPVTAKLESLTLSFCGHKLLLSVPLFRGPLKYFFKDYKNYYYLPKEDMAIHKSVAEYVDEANKEKAKASNCYQNVTGTFLPCFDKNYKGLCMAAYRKPPYYLKADENFWENAKEIRSYVEHLITHLFPMTP